MIIRMMYVLPLILGRTYDLKKSSVGVDIFPKEATQNLKIIQESFYRSSYKTVETFTDVKEVLEINGDLSLGIKAGLFSFRGMGSYVKDTVNVQNAVDILTKVSFRTVSKSLPLSAKPMNMWFNMRNEYLGTHFVRSILYGGDLIACVRFKALKSEYLNGIRATIKSSMATGSALDLVGEGKLESLDKKLKKNATMEINYYATVTLEGVPNTIKGLRDLVRNFENHVKKENDGLGVPVEVELEELSSLNQTISYLKNTDLEAELKLFEDCFDDLLGTKSKLKTWISSLPDNLSKEHEQQISDFSEKLSTVLRKFIHTIANLNLEKGSDQLNEAKTLYKEKKRFPMPGKFNQEFNRLKNKIVLPSRNLDDTGSTVYTHYGASECVNEEFTSTVFSGYLASSPRNVTGSGYNYLCFPRVNPRNANEELKGDTVLIAGVKYGLLETKPSKINVNNVVLKGVMCSVCLVKQRSNVFTFLGQKQCPEDSGWTLQYSGFMMASTDTTRSQNICVDLRPDATEDERVFLDQRISFVLAQQDEKNKFIPCVVCSK